MAIIVFILVIYFIKDYKGDPYKFKGNALDYSEDRGEVDYEVLTKNSNKSLNVYKLKFKSKPFLEEETIIYGLLYVPKNREKAPGLIFLPGGGGTKESRERIALKIVEEGYAVLTIDQRGIGETEGIYLNLEQDYKVFSERKEPMQHLAVYDVLRSYDVLREFKEAEIDGENVAIIGESMGARYGIIAAAIDKRLKGVIAISTSGFHVELNPLNPANNYLVSVDPDHYIAKISPNFVAMLHGTNDTVVSLKDAQITFNKAKEPKRFFIAENCQHGYCEKMGEELKSILKEMFGEGTV